MRIFIMQPLTIGYSPCPNDTYIFYALVHGKIDNNGLRFLERLEDVETLNRLALERVLDLSKVSCHALGFIRDEYCVLRTGGALGRGCGPLVVARDFGSMDELKGKKVALPGRYTTASLLFSLYGAGCGEIVFLPFHMIMGAVAKGEVDAGVIIHESRFTYASHGLKKVMDLGDWWEKETGHPIPLGCVVARRSMGERLLSGMERMLRESILYSDSNPSEVKGYIRSHSQEMSDEVCAAHIDLYVNDYSLELGREGESAMEALLDRAESFGLMPVSAKSLFIK
jgi:1,4-dihydroxy-6-naphthoate synthase